MRMEDDAWKDDGDWVGLGYDEDDDLNGDDGVGQRDG